MNKLTKERKLLKYAIKSSIKKKMFNSSFFFTYWFDVRGKSYYFLFKNNKNVTNIQFVELISLVKQFSSIKNYHLSPIFSSVEEFKETLEKLIETFFSNDFSDKKITEFVDTYLILLLNSLVISPLQGSATIHLNPFTDLNLSSVCSHSGYIHSCGNAIFIRNAEKIEYNDFLGSIRKHFTKFKRRKTLTPFIVYAHEDFSKFDREETNFLKNGLDDVKIYISKYFFKELSIDEILIKLEKNLKANCIFPSPGNYKSFTIEKKNDTNIEKNKAIWLVSDKGILDSSDKSRYFCCYEQLFINRNPFHLFDENKPGWNNHITIPHTLAGAILNISLSTLINKKKTLSICDPFAGSSTFLIEALKYKNVKLFGFDLEKIGIHMLHDNELFFNLSSIEYRLIIKRLNKIKNYYEFIGNNPKKGIKFDNLVKHVGKKEIILLNKCLDFAYDYEFNEKKLSY
ncbi:hypothetical protein [Leptospira levettii]|uniref:hypothetical protein n=1 Tax=Leptospira levettii TaxID=2023178 RepID=UPI0010832728|nr:hypothetical protein [Leptospira levettii]TGK92553.1 hypothetical protein EHQ34_18235 [Leptospira levettii]